MPLKFPDLHYVFIAILLFLFVLHLDCDTGGHKTPVVLAGIDVLEKNEFEILKGKKVGLITNQTGVNRKGVSTIDLLYENTDLVALFSPEHGIRGEGDQLIDSSIDERTGLTIHSLYGKTKRPTEEMLAGIDVLVYDIQDVGCRFYTYITTLGYAMEEAAKHGIEFVVLDRPDPINGVNVEGQILDPQWRHFIGYFEIPIRYGMTVGEIARFHNEENQVGADLTVVKMEDWKREMWFDETGLIWIRPSPNMPDLDAATLYPGIGCFERTNLSVGRGTDKPFRYVGAPWIDKIALVDSLRNSPLKGAEFYPISFTPTARKYVGEECHGVEMKVTNRDKLKPLDCFVYMAYFIKKQAPNEFEYTEMKWNVGSTSAQEHLDKSTDPIDIISNWDRPLRDFKLLRGKYLMY